MKKLVLLTMVFVLSISSYATLQEPDMIIINGKEFFINNGGFDNESVGYFPLSKCTYKINWPALDHNYSTSNRRGYIATWELRNDSLFLIKVCKSDFTLIPLKQLFPEINCSKGLFANWFNDMIIVLNKESLLSSNDSIRKEGFILYAKFQNGKIAYMEKNKTSKTDG